MFHKETAKSGVSKKNEVVQKIYILNRKTDFMPQTDYFPLSIDLLSDKEKRQYEEQDSLRAHQYIIRPLLNTATQALVYKGTSSEHEGMFGVIVDKPIELSKIPILKSHKGKYIFDLEKECIIGYEFLWNATAHKRGSIVLLLPYDFDFSSILPHCCDCNFLETPNMGQSPGAVKLCRGVRENGGLAAILSASNGIEWMDIYAPDARIAEIIDLAKKLCAKKTCLNNRI